MAKLAEEIPIWRDMAASFVVMRFLGTTSASSTTRDMLYSLCSQIQTLQHSTSETPYEIPRVCIMISPQNVWSPGIEMNGYGVAYYII